MDYMDSNKIGQRIENKLIHALGRTISEATNDEIYKAAAECIRDDIMISWADSRKRRRVERLSSMVTIFWKNLRKQKNVSDIFQRSHLYILI